MKNRPALQGLPTNQYTNGDSVQTINNKKTISTPFGEAENASSLLNNIPSSKEDTFHSSGQNQGSPSEQVDAPAPSTLNTNVLPPPPLPPTNSSLPPPPPPPPLSKPYQQATPAPHPTPVHALTPTPARAPAPPPIPVHAPSPIPVSTPAPAPVRAPVRAPAPTPGSSPAIPYHLANTNQTIHSTPNKTNSIGQNYYYNSSGELVYGTSTFLLLLSIP